ncbi:MAG TPA: dihydroorotate dehydrogenase electron transfer subunit [Lacipirellulaceae bacterium]|nr:dihydroorotate dehydrogenase electron transfer subunit [Lacipirellulaceae bacterium]
MNDGAQAVAAHPLAAPYCADRAVQCRAAVVENVPLARDTYRIRLACPEIGRRITPGQFVMVRLPVGNDPLLARPLALYDTWHDAAGAVQGIDVAYLVVGRMTGRLAQLRSGEDLDVWGPLGNGFPAIATQHLIMVAGGIGQTPFLALGREALAGRVYGDPPRQRPAVARATLCYGVRTADLLAGADDFRAAGIDLHVASDDGSVGRPGLVTALLAEVLDGAHGDEVRLACCGPEPMMEAVAEMAAERGLTCDVSLETPMACGIGICFSCVARVRQPDGGWDYKRTCVEGPIFDAQRIVWRCRRTAAVSWRRARWP